MITLTDTQFQIIEAFLENTKNQGETKKGLSSAALGKSGINRRTFEINQEYLLENHLLKVVHEEKHGVQTWKYYDVTRVGVLAYLRKISPSKVNKTIKVIERFFPLIAKHWKKIVKLYSVYTNNILKKSIDCISVEEQILFISSDIGKGRFIRNPQEIMTLRFENLRVTFMKNFGVNVYENMDDPDTLTIRNYEKLEKELTSLMTFVFYFYLVNLPYDTEEKDDIWYDYHVTIKEGKVVIKTKERVDNYLKILNKFNDEILNAANTVLEIIKNDKEITQIFRNNLNEIKEKFTLPESISILDKVVG